ncbi:hypothetical protein B005_3630 [Nocardiopsis alba ATCC BAA-2165]|uniref:Uncharacterized protein n=1 Tax=Nocardiopsis alba (strain ATCC BAA-2165 / BE74) TaxID=1205910 RepID=J7LE01_NOCAA|nr:hypothetical protein B005_3630 [Nocardiopsis alba ATCC BAA-2165]
MFDRSPPARGNRCQGWGGVFAGLPGGPTPGGETTPRSYGVRSR